VSAERPASNVEHRKGLRCPKCGCADFYDESGLPVGFVTTHTVPLVGVIRRYKYCRNCGKRIRTKEVVEKELDTTQ